MQNNIEAIINQLTPIFREVFDDDELVINEFTTAEDIDGWDSLSHIRLIVSIEKLLSLRFTASEISGLVNLGDMAGLILEKQAHA